MGRDRAGGMEALWDLSTGGMGQDPEVVAAAGEFSMGLVAGVQTPQTATSWICVSSCSGPPLAAAAA